MPVVVITLIQYDVSGCSFSVFQIIVISFVDPTSIVVGNVGETDASVVALYHVAPGFNLITTDCIVAVALPVFLTVILVVF